MSAFLCKKLVFFGKNSTFSTRAVLEIFEFCFQVLYDEKLILMKTSFINHASIIQLPDGCKLAINMKKDNHCHFSDFPFSFSFFRVVLCVLIITTAQLHSSKPELRFCTGSNSVCNLSEI